MQTHAKNNAANFSGYAAAAKITKLTFWKFSIKIKDQYLKAKYQTPQENRSNDVCKFRRYAL